MMSVLLQMFQFVWWG